MFYSKGKDKLAIIANWIRGDSSHGFASPRHGASGIPFRLFEWLNTAAAVAQASGIIWTKQFIVIRTHPLETHCTAPHRLETPIASTDGDASSIVMIGAFGTSCCTLSSVELALANGVSIR